MLEFYGNNIQLVNNVPYTCSYGKITIDGEDWTVSEDGKTITTPNNVKITTTFEEYHGLHYNTTYYLATGYVDWECFRIQEDSNLDIGFWVTNVAWYNNQGNVASLMESWILSMDGRNIYMENGDGELYLLASTDLIYPWAAAYNDNYNGIIGGTPEDNDYVIYEKYYYTYSSAQNGYIPCLRDSSQTFDASELEDKIYGVNVIIPE